MLVSWARVASLMHDRMIASRSLSVLIDRNLVSPGTMVSVTRRLCRSVLSHIAHAASRPAGIASAHQAAHADRLGGREKLGRHALIYLRPPAKIPETCLFFSLSTGYAQKDDRHILPKGHPIRCGPSGPHLSPHHPRRNGPI